MASIVVTGFGVFAGVEDNPSKRIIEELQATHFHPEQAKSVSFKVLDVAVDHCSNIHEEFLGMLGPNSVFVHIGVDSKATCIKLEQCAYNNMNFRVPDVCGYQPVDCQICSDTALDCPLYSQLPLPKLCSELNSTCPASSAAAPIVSSEPLVALSEDPGRYLCNYTYYQALLHQQRRGLPLYAVFVHVPPFEAISQEVQVMLIKDIVNRIAEICAPQTCGSD
jgi:pyroglutamyl-peptidase